MNESMNGARMYVKTSANVCTYVDNEIFVGIHTNQRVSVNTNTHKHTGMQTDTIQQRQRIEPTSESERVEEKEANRHNPHVHVSR